MEQAFDVIMRLFRGETVTEKTDWFTCDDAVLQIRPYSDFDIAVASHRCRRRARSSPAATAPGCCRSPRPSRPGFGVLDYNYQVWQDEATRNGHDGAARASGG